MPLWSLDEARRIHGILSETGVLPASSESMTQMMRCGMTGRVAFDCEPDVATGWADSGYAWQTREEWVDPLLFYSRLCFL